MVFSTRGAPAVFDHCNLIGKFGGKVKQTCGHLKHDFVLWELKPEFSWKCQSLGSTN